ncbi:hypothetical protein CYPRO_2311 [Cyclonatronum proteinivorum]|uniref:Uncharacterized protein n=1 Tax=Cyclonatronum proteinivorum TaxID=1457365 RepID=A0A345UM55_9BACT|nr:hypothetical protein [Cyclonatronum proteinivorum]AXJ01557.1 hypothetical protein CYPRO_2311 [Cyclonatronum proteinivorum]
MKTIPKITAVLLISFIALVLMAANVAMVSQFRAEIPDPAKNEINIQWTVQQESGVMHYELMRKMVRDSDFVLLATVDVLPPSSQPNQYQYLDRNVFRNAGNTEPVIYELNVVFTNGERRFIGQAEVNYTSTAVRRTWGSIKAMFQ